MSLCLPCPHKAGVLKGTCVCDSRSTGTWEKILGCLFLHLCISFLCVHVYYLHHIYTFKIVHVGNRNT